MRKFLIFLFVLFMLVGNVEAATYCLRNDGTAGSKTAATDCLTVANCMNETVHNAQTFAANDVILVCPHGGAFDYQVTTPSSGGSGTEIRYAGQYSATYGWPIFNEGFKLATNYIIAYGMEIRAGIAESGTKVFEGIRIANTSRSWQAAEETPVTGWLTTNKFIVGTGIGMTGGGTSVTPEIRWRNKTDEGAWTALASTGELKYGDCTALTDEANLTTGNFGTSSGKTKVEGVKCEQENSAVAGGATTLATEQYTEIQACFDPANGDPGDEYAFALFESAAQIGSESLSTLTLEGCLLGDNYQPTAASSGSAAAWTDKDYMGAGYKDTSTSHCICKLIFKLTHAGTTIESFTFVAKIGQINGDKDISTIEGTSTGVQGNDAWSGTPVEFTFSPCVNVSSGTEYALIVGRTISSAQTGWIEVHYEGTGAWGEGTGISRWNDDGALPWPDPSSEFNATADLWIKIYEE